MTQEGRFLGVIQARSKFGRFELVSAPHVARRRGWGSYTCSSRKSGNYHIRQRRDAFCSQALALRVATYEESVQLRMQCMLVRQLMSVAPKKEAKFKCKTVYSANTIPINDRYRGDDTSASLHRSYCRVMQGLSISPIPRASS